MPNAQMKGNRSIWGQWAFQWVTRVSRRGSSRESRFVQLTPWTGMNLRCGLYSEQPDVNFQRSPIREEATSCVDGHHWTTAFWKVRASPKGTIRNQGQERSRQSKKTVGNMDSVGLELWQSLTESQTECLLATGGCTLHSAPMPTRSLWKPPPALGTSSAPSGVRVCARVCVQNKSPFLLFFFGRKKWVLFSFLPSLPPRPTILAYSCDKNSKEGFWESSKCLKGRGRIFYQSGHQKDLTGGDKV